MGFRRFIKCDAQGSVTEEHLSRAKPAGDWIEIPAAQMHLLGLGPHRIRWDEGVGLSEKPRIRLSVGAFSWPADGSTPLAIGVRGEDLTPEATIRVLVNNTPYEVGQHDDLMLTSDAPGDYIIRVSDPYYYAVPAEMIVTATEVEDGPAD